VQLCYICFDSYVLTHFCFDYLIGSVILGRFYVCIFHRNDLEVTDAFVKEFNESKYHAEREKLRCQSEKMLERIKVVLHVLHVSLAYLSLYFRFDRQVIVNTARGSDGCIVFSIVKKCANQITDEPLHLA